VALPPPSSSDDEGCVALERTRDGFVESYTTHPSDVCVWGAVALSPGGFALPVCTPIGPDRAHPTSLPGEALLYIGVSCPFCNPPSK
jgi:hypothetical protein